MRPAPLLMAGLFAVLVLLALTAAAGAQGAHHRAARGPVELPYFMDFRARDGGVLGHTFVVYGRIDGRGRAREAGSAGLYPDDKYSESFLPVFIPVPAYVNIKKEDPSLAVGAVYRRRLSARQYARLQLALLRLRTQHGRWHLVFNNCNDFAAQVAHAIGLWTPPSLVRPDTFVRGLRALNGPGH